MEVTNPLPISPKSELEGDGSSPRSGDFHSTAALTKKVSQPLRKQEPNIIRIQVGESANHTFDESIMVQVKQDPFVTHETVMRSQLSPTASAFDPYARPKNIHAFENDGPIASLLSFDIGLSRSVMISSSPALSPSKIENFLSQLETKGRKAHGNHSIQTLEESFLVEFDDIRDSCLLYVESRLLQKSWKVQYVRGTLLQPETYEDNEEWTQSDALVIFAVGVKSGVDINNPQILRDVQESLQQFGCIFAFSITTALQNNPFHMIAEFCNILAARSAFDKCKHGLITPSIRITAIRMNGKALQTEGILIPSTQLGHATLQWSNKTAEQMSDGTHLAESSIDSHFPLIPLLFESSTSPNIPYSLDSMVTIDHSRASSSRSAASSPFRPIPSSFQTPPSPALSVPSNSTSPRSFNSACRPHMRREHPPTLARLGSTNPAGHHNQVDINRISDGIDVRTTIMLRNIPNKVDQAMLKRLVDESSWGKYDFMYLRIDFANDCNVGYAFINFVDPLDIIEFVKARGNQRWNCFKSDKIAEISYATIQGKDCLVQKFRNSSVMLEAAHYRPKLYFTSNGPVPEIAGQEEPFPRPDNQSKMKRSCENAEHVGLFTPNVGQHFRDEQRRRRSQYDRGTRLAALEEFDYEGAIQQLYLTTN